MFDLNRFVKFPAEGGLDSKKSRKNNEGRKSLSKKDRKNIKVRKNRNIKEKL